MHDDFRHILRQSTRAEHDALDDMISRLDLTTTCGFLAFARIHFHCFGAMAAAARPGSWACDALGKMHTQLGKDIAILGGSRPKLAPPDLGKIHPLALDYMVAGSRLGTKVLAKRWAQADDPAVAQANSYFGASDISDAWRETCQNLSAIDPVGAQAHDIKKDTSRLFRLFADTSKRLSPQLSGMED